MRQFDFHEFLGYIAPGMLLLIGVICIWPDGEKVLPVTDITFGAFGVGVVLAYAAGQLIQAFGNVIEKRFWWFWGGMPTDWIRTCKHELIAPTQRERVKANVARMLNRNSFEFDDVTAKRWYSITRQVYAAVAGADRAVRVDVFNGHYGLCRGTTASLLFLLAMSLLVNWHTWKVHVMLVSLFFLAIYRMHRFGVHYGRELFVQFLELPDSQENGKA